MTRSTKTDKARQLNAAFAMLRRNTPLPEAMQRLSGEFDLSERQAYRYLAEATHLKRPVEVRSECCFRHAPAQYAVARGYAALVWRVRPIGTSSLSVPGGGDASEASGRSPI